MLVEVSVPIEFSDAVTVDMIRRSGITVANESTEEWFTMQAEVCSVHRKTKKYKSKINKQQIFFRYP